MSLQLDKQKKAQAPINIKELIKKLQQEKPKHTPNDVEQAKKRLSPQWVDHIDRQMFVLQKKIHQ